VKQTSVARQNRSALAKSAAYLQSFMLYLAETEIDKIKDDSNGPNFFTLQHHGPTVVAIN